MIAAYRQARRLWREWRDRRRQEDLMLWIEREWL